MFWREGIMRTSNIQHPPTSNPALPSIYFILVNLYTQHQIFLPFKYYGKSFEPKINMNPEYFDVFSSPVQGVTMSNKNIDEQVKNMERNPDSNENEYSTNESFKFNKGTDTVQDDQIHNNSPQNTEESRRYNDINFDKEASNEDSDTPDISEHLTTETEKVSSSIPFSDNIRTEQGANSSNEVDWSEVNVVEISDYDVSDDGDIFTEDDDEDEKANDDDYDNSDIEITNIREVSTDPELPHSEYYKNTKSNTSNENGDDNEISDKDEGEVDENVNYKTTESNTDNNSDEGETSPWLNDWHDMFHNEPRNLRNFKFSFPEDEKENRSSNEDNKFDDSADESDSPFTSIDDQSDIEIVDKDEFEKATKDKKRSSNEEEIINDDEQRKKKPKYNERLFKKQKNGKKNTTNSTSSSKGNSYFSTFCSRPFPSSYYGENTFGFKSNDSDFTTNVDGSDIWDNPILSSESIFGGYRRDQNGDHRKVDPIIDNACNNTKDDVPDKSTRPPNYGSWSFVWENYNKSKDHKGNDQTEEKAKQKSEKEKKERQEWQEKEKKERQEWQEKEKKKLDERWKKRRERERERLEKEEEYRTRKQNRYRTSQSSYEKLWESYRENFRQAKEKWNQARFSYTYSSHKEPQTPKYGYENFYQKSSRPTSNFKRTSTASDQMFYKYYANIFAQQPPPSPPPPPITPHSYIEYEKKWQQLQNNSPIKTVNDVPWPVKTSNYKDLNQGSILVFLGTDNSILKKERVRWHPDKALRKLGISHEIIKKFTNNNSDSVKEGKAAEKDINNLDHTDTEMKLIVEGVTKTFQIINSLWEMYNK